MKILHGILDPKIRANKQKWKQYAAANDSEGYIKSVAKVVEDAFAEFGQF